MGEWKPDSVTGWGMFLVGGQASKAREPGKGALHRPAFGHRHEAPRGRGLAGQLMLQVQVGQVPGEVPAVGLLGEHRVQAPGPPGALGPERASGRS